MRVVATITVCVYATLGVASAQAPSEDPPPRQEDFDPWDQPPVPPASVEDRGQLQGETGCADCYDNACWEHGQTGWLGDGLARFHEFTSRNSQTHGRAVGLGKPLRGTSWLNRPFEVSMDFGALLMTNRPAPGVRAAHDGFAALRLGWDWDHYWGTQARLGWSTPNLTSTASNAGESDNLFMADLSLMYYPWGDSAIRPYWRMGMGLTDIQFTNSNGVRQQENLFTVPFGVGVKHQFRRWLVGRVEVVNNLALGMNEANTMNNFTLTAGLEARYGASPGGYWAWRPRGYAW